MVPYENPIAHEELLRHKSHYEANISNQKMPPLYALKQTAIRSMTELEGWCSKEKAEVLIDYINLLHPTTVVEIGVFGGKSLVPMAYALKHLGHGKIYGIDPWSSIESAEGMDGVNKEYWSQVNHTAIYEGLVRKIAKFGLNDYIQLIKKTSEEAEAIEEIDLLHIDGNHSEKTSLIDVTKWVPFVRSGGLIIFDDVNWHTTGLAVQWLDENCDKLTEFRGDNIWGVWVKR